MFHLFKKSDKKILEQYAKLMRQGLLYQRSSRLPTSEEDMKRILIESFLDSFKEKDRRKADCCATGYVYLANFLVKKDYEIITQTDKILFSGIGRPLQAGDIEKMAKKLSKIEGDSEIRKKLVEKAELLNKEWDYKIEEIAKTLESNK
jgi:hypothetical protein